MNKATLGAITALALTSATTIGASPCSSSCSGDKDKSWASTQLVSYESTKNIVEVAQSAGTFDTLIAAAKAAGLVGALTGDGPITVLAPTDDAFAKLPAGTVESLLKPENKDKLASILKYHVVSGRVYSDEAIKLGEASTAQGSSVTIS